MKIEKHPNYLAAIDHKRDRVFVLAPPDLSAIRVNGKWRYCTPLSSDEIPDFTLITDYEQALKFVNEARDALEEKVN